MKAIKIFLLFTMIFSFFGCENSDDRVIIGANLPLTGKKSYYGISAMNGIEIALETISQDYPEKSKNFSIIYEDNQAKAKKTISAMSKLININKVPAIIGGGTSTESMAAAPIANDTKTVLISPISSATSLSEAGRYFFRTCPTDLDQAHDLGKWILDKNIKKIAIIYANSTWGTGFKNDFTKYYKNHGGKIIKIESSDPGANDFRSQLTIIKNLDIEALVFITYAVEGGILVRQAREMEMTEYIFGADPWSQKDFRTGSNKYNEGVMYTTPIQHESEKFNRFKDEYKKKFNEEPDVYSSNGYDCLMVLWEAYYVGKCKTGKEFQLYLQNIEYDGVTGITKFDNKGNVKGKHFGRFRIIEGKPNLVKY